MDGGGVRGALSAWASITGITGAPFDSYLTLRGIRTFYARIDRQQASASSIAAFLEAHPAVAAVHYPGLSAHSDHAIARAQQSGFGAMLSFESRGRLEAVRRFAAGIEVFTLAETLGGIESLIAHTATMAHVGMSAEARRKAGINDGLLRMSVGLEAESDLITDLERSLAAVG